MFRNCEFNYQGGVWNMVFVGTRGAPGNHCGNSGGGPFVTVDVAPSVIEKPYIVLDGNNYKLMVPRLELNKVGTTPNFSNADEYDFSQVFVASESTDVSTINQKIA